MESIEKEFDLEFKEFNQVRHIRGADTYRFNVDGCFIWMSEEDINLNIKEFPEHKEELEKVLRRGE